MAEKQRKPQMVVPPNGSAAPLDPFDPASWVKPEDDRLTPKGDQLPSSIHCDGRRRLGSFGCIRTPAIAASSGSSRIVAGVETAPTGSGHPI